MLRTEGRVTMIDGILAVAVLLGLPLNAALGWWWADPAAGYVLVYYAAARCGRSSRQITDGGNRRHTGGSRPHASVWRTGSRFRPPAARCRWVVAWWNPSAGGEDGSRDLPNELAQLEQFFMRHLVG